jgi:hypothetical protein
LPNDLFFLQKNVGRVLANEQDVIDVIRSGNMMKANIVDMAKMSYGEQLKVSCSRYLFSFSKESHLFE